MRAVNLIAAVILLIVARPGYATHLRSVEITSKPINCNTFTYEITIIGYINTGSPVSFGGDNDFLSFGDGQKLNVPVLIPVIIDPLLQVGRVEFKTIHTFQSPGSYTLSYQEDNRNEGIVNMEESVSTSFYTESKIIIAPGVCNTSPKLSIVPIDRACKGVTFYHNAGAFDTDGDSLSYELVVPKQSADETVKNYSLPNDAKFYGTGFNMGNENQNGPPVISIDPLDGTITWDSPGSIGEYCIAIKISEWKYDSDTATWYLMGYVVRDMQIIVDDCANQKPNVDVPEDICVIAGNTVDFIINASDPDNDIVVIEAASEILMLDNNPGMVTPLNGVLQSTKPPEDTAAMRFTWNTTCDDVREQSYKIIFKITDRPPSGTRLVRFKTVFIHLLAPAPEYQSVTVNPISKEVELKLKNYHCEDVQRFQIWRRVTKYNYEQPECESGMPSFLNYALVGEIPGDASSYIDSNLSFGAEYCYRIVALVAGGNVASKISIDTCIIPKPAEAPVITNVSVEKTHDSNGRMFVRWTSPFEIDQVQYPPPYQYRVYRSAGLSDNSPYQLVTANAISDTVFTDDGINTKDFSFHYKIELFVPALTTLPVDTSSSASSVRLSTNAQPNSIDLSWVSTTPWYNYTQKFPYHLIYRASDQDSVFQLIDSVNVNLDGFAYTDKGLHQNLGLEANTKYYYRILTRGAYGNPRIIEPVENWSQVATDNLLDTIPPCPPVATLKYVDCRSLPCTGNKYENNLSWQDNTACDTDISTYNVYVRDDKTQSFVFLASVNTPNFDHTNLPTRAKCYAITSLDFSGNESEFSDEVCSDNCPYFELPNVFTPDNGDETNDLFAAFTLTSNDTTKCARFVLNVGVTIYDRWGQEVYEKQLIDYNGEYILWNGTTNSGMEVSPGVYYYAADVLFDTSDPKKRHQLFKGWVQVVR